MECSTDRTGRTDWIVPDCRVRTSRVPRVAIVAPKSFGRSGQRALWARPARGNAWGNHRTVLRSTVSGPVRFVFTY